MYLDLSWTGGGGQITEDSFCTYVCSIYTHTHTHTQSCSQTRLTSTYMQTQVYKHTNTHHALRFLEECGEKLVTLRLACCPYIGEKSMATIGRICKQLEGTVTVYVCVCVHACKLLNLILFCFFRSLFI